MGGALVQEFPVAQAEDTAIHAWESDVYVEVVVISSELEHLPPVNTKLDGEVSEGLVPSNEVWIVWRCRELWRPRIEIKIKKQTHTGEGASLHDSYFAGHLRGSNVLLERGGVEVEVKQLNGRGQFFVSVAL
jgi:hypothetical protein